MTVLFGDIGSTIYDFTADAIKDVSFTKVIAKLPDGNEVSTPVKTMSPISSSWMQGSRFLMLPFEQKMEIFFTLTATMNR